MHVQHVLPPRDGAAAGSVDISSNVFEPIRWESSKVVGVTCLLEQ